MTTNKATWKWNRQNDAYLTAKGESCTNPRARIYACWARPKKSPFVWTVYVQGRAMTVCRDTKTAMKLGREFSEFDPSEQ